MEAQISADMKTPVLSHRPGPEGSAGDKSRKRESEALGRTQSADRDQQVTPNTFHQGVHSVFYLSGRNNALFSRR